MNKKPRILLTGASGSIGKEVARRLADKSDHYELTYFDLDNRRVRRKLRQYHGKAHLHFGDIRNKSDVEAITKNQDIVLHLAALLPPMSIDHPEEARDINIEGTRSLIECLERNSPGCFVLYTSSVAVYGDRVKNYWLSTSDELKASQGDVYGETKIAAEQLTSATKLQWTILRLTAIMGDHKPSRLMFHQPLATKMEIATISDTAKAIVGALEHLDELNGKTFNLGGGEACRIQYDDFLDRSFDALGLGQVNFPAKAFAMKNFHCGYFTDSDVLEEILHFRSDTFDDYLKLEAAKLSWLERLILPFVRGLVKRWLLTLSEPYRAWKTQDAEQISKFF